MGELSDTGAAPEHVTFEYVMKLAEKLYSPAQNREKKN
jgi:hypothetical protein